MASGDGLVVGVITGDIELSGGCGVGLYIAIAIVPFHPCDKEAAELEVPQTGKFCGVNPCQKIVAGDVVTALKILLTALKVLGTAKVHCQRLRARN